MNRDNSDSIRWSLTFVILTSILASIEGEVVFFVSTLIGNRIYGFSICFLIVRLSQTFIGLHAAIFRNRYVIAINWMIALVEIVCVAILLGFVKFTEMFNSMFMNANIPPKYDHHMANLAWTYLVYTVIIKVIFVLVTVYLSFM